MKIDVPKYYKSLDTLPIYNFIKILENPKDNIWYLLVHDINDEPPELSTIDRVFLFEKWRLMLYELPVFDDEFMEVYNSWRIATLDLLLQVQKYNSECLECVVYNKEMPIPNYKFQNCFTTFAEYIRILSEKYTDFTLSYYEFKIENFNKIKKPAKANKILEFKKQFYIKEEYDLFVADKDLQRDVFFNKIYDKKIYKEKNILAYSNYIENFFVDERKDLVGLIALRGIIFDYQNLDKVPIKEEFNLFDDIAILNYLTKQNLDIKKSCVKELFALKKLAENINKKNSNAI
jgi:hypothetical protein